MELTIFFVLVLILIIIFCIVKPDRQDYKQNNFFVEFEKTTQETTQEITYDNYSGTIFIISNFASFGEDVFKIGMTTRENYKQRIYELSSSAVPFPFDTNCIIRTQYPDRLLKRFFRELKSYRINTTNDNIGFYKIDINELEKITLSIVADAKFNKSISNFPSVLHNQIIN